MKKTNFLPGISIFYVLQICSNFIPVDFHKSMLQSKHYNPSLVSQNTIWKRVKFLYDENILLNREPSSTLRIPKIMHHIWIGSTFPNHLKKLRQTWIDHHPDWQHILWTDKEIRKFGLINQAHYDAAKNLGEKADIARYEILYRTGGLYIDTDFECLQSFNELHHYCDFYAGISSEAMFEVYNGMIGSRAKHPILLACIEGIQKQNIASRNNNNPNAIMSRTGPYFFTKQIERYISSSSDRTVLFPITYFYPWPNYCRHQKERSEIEKWIKPETLAIHHWHVSWNK